MYKGYQRKSVVKELNKEPWGKPYQIVMKKLRPKTLPTTITLEPRILDKIVGELFPEAGPRAENRDRTGRQGNSETNINIELRELALLAFQKKTKRSVTPGIDGIHMKVFGVCANFISEDVVIMYNNCLEQGKFPKEWKTSELILIPKRGNKDDNSASTYRPICLISEVGKIFEKIIIE